MKGLIIGTIVTIISGLIIYGIFKEDVTDRAQYRIEGGNERIYYTDTFRMFGKGIMFDDVYGKKIILMGDIDIEYINKQK